MSRITSNDARGLVEAYQAVYAPQELTEEQVWEEVENWVNSLLEEGYDLSDYTWEEMYEAYIEEAPVSPVFNTKGFGDFYNKQATSQGMDKTFRAGGGQASLRAGKTPLDIMKQGAANLRSSTSTRTPATPAARPAAAAPAARPAAAAPAARPAAAATPSAKPAMGPTGKPLVGGIERRIPRRDEMDAARAYRTPAATTGTLGAATAAASKPAAFSPTPAAAPAPKPAAAPAPTPAAAPAPKPSPSATGSKKPGSVFSHFDPFDVIKGHLLDEGYADTEESALAIMANMSEEWRVSIVEAQEARNNPEKYEDEQRKKKSKKQRAMDDPHTGINSPAFAAFMKQQGR